ncbi:hypothetical protein B6A27_17650 [Anoxybacillus sp. UARK-01]|uniref:YncE family protein n=1 Tax=Anoxybacillus sp. UARK-01 TaxID=1895648 RepID=UPI0009BC58FE|nr:YncE family protein [Anoxybacillus sp. UARK-01]OQM44284.1 hypothetical protein B6A27_17650 [Anoxybacillus sp. UARK-01]
MRLALVLAFMFVSLLMGCERQEEFTPIPKRMKVLISINIKDGSVTFFDLKREKKYAQWELGQPIQGGVLLNNGSTLLLYGHELDRAYEYNLATGKMEKEWKIGKGIISALVSNDQQHLLLADQNQKAIRIFHMNGKENGSIKIGSQPLTLLQNSTGTRVYAIDFQDEKAAVIDMEKHQVTHTFSVPKFALGGLLREREQELWVGGHGSGSSVETVIHIYSLPSGTLMKTIPAPEMPISFAETNEGIFALSHGSNTVRKWDHAGEEKASITVGANPFVMIGESHYLYVASYDSNEVTVIDGRTLQVVQRLTTGKGPFQLMIREEG